jgi:hypothetical protein
MNKEEEVCINEIIICVSLSWSFDFKVVVVGDGRWADPDGREHCSLSIYLSLGILLHFLAHSHTSFFQYVNVAYTSIFFFHVHVFTTA